MSKNVPRIAKVENIKITPEENARRIRKAEETLARICLYSINNSDKSNELMLR